MEKQDESNVGFMAANTTFILQLRDQAVILNFKSPTLHAALSSAFQEKKKMFLLDLKGTRERNPRS